uniref:WW domain-containing protein n=2 Tax=Kalmanozyma brasiliensis (strain GHG001) TaxID=1365824 RepID=V5F252_KALBG
MGDNASAGPSSLLPFGWTSHISPAGRTYYHNAASGKSTYMFPTPKREKPTSKTAIPHTVGWFKVTTNRENVFYFHPDSKRSEWIPPPEVSSALRRVEEEEASEKERVRREQEDRERAERERARQEEREKKRKAEEGVLITEFDASKRARADEEEEDEESIASDEEAQPPVYKPDAPQDDESIPEEENDDDADDEEEEWQRQMAEQMAAEAEAEANANADHEPHSRPDDASSDPATQPQAPPTTLEDQKLAFTTHLTSLNNTPHEINPMAPWDLESLKFSTHPSFLALPSRDREDVFNEWCKLRIREKRAARSAAASSTTTASPSRAPRADPPSAESTFLALLRAEVRSTRTKYPDFKAAFSRDPRFTSYSRDADRERLFKRHLFELGEEKRRAASKAEREFLDLLSDRLPGNYRGKVVGADGVKEKVMEVWTEAKRGVVEDKRYDAVGSSTRRFELFCDWAKGERRAPPTAPASSRANGTSTDAATGTKEQDDASSRAREKEAARARALRQREEAVRLERNRLARVNRSALSAATREESLLSFRQLLLDAVHSPHVSYHSAVPQLARDGRFDAPGLTDGDRERLFAEHQERLGEKEGDRIGLVFARYAKTLDTHRDDVLAQTVEDEALAHPPLNVYRENRGLLETAYDRWNASRQADAEKSFKEMLHESAFVDFWGRLKKQASTMEPSANPKEEGEEDDEGEGTTLVDMARKVDLREIESVLRNDARFRAWRHAPEQRQRWIREHLMGLAAPAKSVHR